MQARSGAAAVSLLDGRVLFSGGADGALALASAETLGTAGTGPAGNMTRARSRHAASLLADGRVLVVGGELVGGLATASAEIYDPASSTWTPVSGMSAPRAGHTLTTLRDGNLLVAGGDSAGVPSALLEVFDAGTGVFYQAAVLATPRSGHAAALLDDGRVLIAGGSDGSSALASSEIYDPQSNTLSTGPDMTQARSALSATTLIDGRVLVVGGSDGVNALASAELLDAGATSFAAVAQSLLAPRSGHLALRLPNNNSVLIVSGDSPVTPLAAAELFTPVTGGFDATGAMVAARALASGNALAAEGQVLVGGGADANGALGSSEIYVFHTVRSDKGDYAPGETVTIVGRRWQPGETVSLVLNEMPTQHEVITLTAVADEHGNFVNTDYAPDVHDLGTKYVVDAIGQGSGLTAQTSFTDGTLNVVSAPAGVTFGMSGTRYTNTTNCTGTTNNANTSHTVSNSGPVPGLQPNATMTDNNSHRLLANATSVQGGTFVSWGCVNASSLLVLNGNQRDICVSGSNGAVVTTCTATYAAPKVNTTTTVTDTPDPTVVGQPVTVNVSVARASGSNTPSGSATVTVAGGSETCAASLSGSGGTATGSCQLTFTSPGARSINASYAGDTNFNSSSGSTPHTVNKAGTTTAITSDTPDPSYVGASYTVSFSVAAQAPGAGTPTGTVNVTGDGAGCSATVAAGSCSITSASAGSKTLTATYVGDTNFNTSSDTETHNVILVPTTTTITADSPDPSVVGGAVTVSVSVSAANSSTVPGSVSIGSGDATPGCTATLSGGAGSCSITYTSTGARTLTASFAGDTAYEASSDTEAHGVNKAGTTTAIDSHNPSPSAVNQDYTVTWTVSVTSPGSGSPGGNVSVSDGSGEGCTAPVGDGQCAFASTSAGSKTLVASYAGDASFSGSSSAGTAHQVNARATSTTVSLSPDTIYVLGSSTATVTVTDIDASNPKSAPTGTVSVSSSVAGDTVGSCAPVAVDAVSASCTVAVSGSSAGTRSIGASYAGNTTHANSDAVQRILTVNKRPTTTTLALDPMSVVVGEASQATVTVVDSSGGGYVPPTGTVVTLSSANGDAITGPCMLMPSGSGASCTVSVTPGSAAVSAHPIVATFPETANFLGSNDSQSLMVYRRTAETTVSFDPSSVLVGQGSTATVTVRDAEPNGTKYDPSGTVTLSGETGDAFTPAASCVLVDGTPGDGMSSCTATVTPDRFGNGVHAISASFAQTDVHLADDGSADLTVSRRSTMTEVSLSPSAVVVNESSAVTVTVTDTSAYTKSDPSGTISFGGEAGDGFSPSTCTLIGGANADDGLSSCTVTVKPTQFGDGTHGISASFVATQIHAASSDSANLSVARRSTSAALSFAPGSVVTGQPSTLTVTVTDTQAQGDVQAPTGDVSVAALEGAGVDAVTGSPCTLAGSGPGVSQCSVTVTPNGVGDGAHGFSATFIQTEVHNGSGGASDLPVSKADTATTLEAAPNPSVFGQSVTLTATVCVSAPGAGVAGGLVTFKDGASVLGSSSLAAGAGCPAASFSSAALTAGTHAISAAYAGDADFNASTGGGSQLVEKAGTTTTITLDTPDPSIIGATFTVKWSVAVNSPGAGTPTGTVQVTGGSGCSATVAAGQCTVAGTAPGTQTLTATYSGDANFLGSSDTESHSVQYSFVGFFQPVDNLPTVNTVKNGSTVPVKWRLLDADGAYITDIATVKSIKYAASSCITAPEDAIEETVATGGTQPRWDGSSQFIYNWKTPATPGKCLRLDVMFADDVTRSASFKLK